MKFLASFFSAAATAALLSACGGSGDDSPPTGGTQSVAITAGNQSAVARATVNGGFSLALVQSETGAAPTSAPAAAAGAERVLRRVARVATTPRRVVASATVHPQSTSQQTDPCGVSGSLVTTWNDADNNGQLDAGDVLTANFQQCQDSASLSFNGTLVITLTGTPTDTDLAANAVFQNVVVVESGVTYTISGAAALHEVDTDTVSSTSLMVGAAGLALAIASPSYNDSIAFESGMLVTSSFLAGGSTLTLAGSFTAQSIGGRVSIATPAALHQQTGDAFPSSGEVVVTGASGSTLTLTPLNVAQVQLQLDANGDGAADGTSVVAWTALIP